MHVPPIPPPHQFQMEKWRKKKTMSAIPLANHKRFAFACTSTNEFFPHFWNLFFAGSTARRARVCAVYCAPFPSLYFISQFAALLVVIPSWGLVCGHVIRKSLDVTKKISATLYPFQCRAAFVQHVRESYTVRRFGLNFRNCHTHTHSPRLGGLSGGIDCIRSTAFAEKPCHTNR